MTDKTRIFGSAVANSAILGTLLLAMFSTSIASAQITVSPTTLNYKTELYTTSTPKSVVVTNTGPAAVSFGAATISGADAGGFAIATDTCSNHTIAPLKKCKIGVSFSATQPIGTT